MSSTIETIDACIIEKINHLQSIITVFDQYEFEPYDTNEIEQFKIQLNEICSTYQLGSVNILAEYYGVGDAQSTTQSTPQSTPQKARNKIYKSYMNFLNKENIICKIKKIYTKIHNLHATYEFVPQDLTKIKKSIDGYNKREFMLIFNDEIENLCAACGNKCLILAKSSEKVCSNSKCGVVDKIYGTVLEDAQPTQENVRNKHGKYDPTKHCRYWIDCIQGEEKIEIPKVVLESLKFRIKQDNQILSDITCDMYRRYLKDIKKTKYNDHVALIRKLISKVAPPKLSEMEKKIIAMLFSRIVQIFNKIKPNVKTNSKSNCPYHPYFIYKIIEHILKDAQDKNRTREILSCIHLQSRETLIENDLTMEIICKHMPEIEYKPTVT